jgi:hypothetical protein
MRSLDAGGLEGPQATDLLLPGVGADFHEIHVPSSIARSTLSAECDLATGTSVDVIAIQGNG